MQVEMQAQANHADVSVNHVRDSSRHAPTVHRPPTVLEEVADSRLWRARLGIPGIYVADRDERDSVYFEVRVHFRRDVGRRIIKVIPVSNWVNGACVRRGHEVQKGEWPQFLPACVLFGELDYERLPEEHYDYLADWADLVLDGVDRYNKLNPPRARRTGPRRDH